MATISLSIPVAGSVTLALHQNNFAAIQAAVNALDTVNYVDASVTRPKLATVTRKVQLVPIILGTTPSVQWPDAATTNLFLNFIIPDDYVSGDITVKVFIRSSVGGNQIRITRSVTRFRDVTATNALESGVASNHAIHASAATDNTYTFTITAAGFQAGDAIEVDLARVGADGNDTNTGSATVDAAWAEYTGRS